MDLKLKDKVAWVTGSSRGIGLAIARRLAEEDCRIALSGRTAPDLTRAHKELQRTFGKERILSFQGDLAAEKNCQAVVDGCLTRWGRLDILIANSGTGRIPGGAEPSDSDWDFALEQNLRVSLRAARAAMPAIEKSGGGSVIAIGSIAGLEAMGAPAGYSTAKAALHAWIKALSREAAQKKIRVNAVIPGNIFFEGGVWDKKLQSNKKGVESYIKSEVPMARFGTPEEVADAAAFLASERASFITGAQLVVDGGQTRTL